MSLRKRVCRCQIRSLHVQIFVRPFQEGDDFQYHFGTHNALRPTIAQHAGALLNEEEEEEFEDEYGDELKPKGIPKAGIELKPTMGPVKLCS